MSNHEPAPPIIGKVPFGDGEATAQMHLITDAELGELSTYPFQELALNFKEWSESDPAAAYNALRTYLIEKRYRGNAGAAALHGLQEHFSDLTVISVRAERAPSLLGLFSRKYYKDSYERAKEVGLFVFGNTDEVRSLTLSYFKGSRLG